jgi:hypothetical protein
MALGSASQKLYTEGDEVAHVTSAQCLQALARKDVVKEHFKIIIPLVLLGKCVARNSPATSASVIN